MKEASELPDKNKIKKIKKTPATLRMTFSQSVLEIELVIETLQWTELCRVAAHIFSLQNLPSLRICADPPIKDASRNQVDRLTRKTSGKYNCKEHFKKSTIKNEKYQPERPWIYTLLCGILLQRFPFTSKHKIPKLLIASCPSTSPRSHMLEINVNFIYKFYLFPGTML